MLAVAHSARGRVREFSRVLALVALAASVGDVLGAQAAEHRVPAAPDTTVRVPELERDVWAELAGPSTISPGNAVRMIYTVSNLEDADLRVAVRLELPDGWRVLSPIDEERTLLSGEDFEGELHVVAARDAPVGRTATVRLWVTIAGETGALYPAVVLRVTRTGGLAPGRQGVTGFVQGFRRGAGSGWDTKPADAGAMQLNGRFTNGTVVSLTGLHGERFDQTPSLSPFGSDETRVTLDVRRGHLSLAASNVLYASGDALMGPFMRAEGARLARTGRVPVELTVGRPRSFIDAPDGHLVRGSVGLLGARVGAKIGLSTLERPVGQYTPAFRVDAGVVELTVTPTPRQRLVVRGGMLAQTTESIRLVPLTLNTGEASYSVNNERGSLSLNGRMMPAALPSLFLAGDQRSAAGSLRLTRTLRLVGSANDSRTETVSQPLLFSSQQYSSGVLWMRNGYRLELRGNKRSTTFTTTTQQEAASLGVGIPLGRIGLDAYGESGRQVRDTTVTPFYVARSGLRWTGASGWATLGVVHADYGFTRATTRSTFAFSVRRAWFELDGGAWAWQGPSFGGSPGVWMSAALPLLGPYEMLVGADFVQGRAGWVRYVDPATGQPLPPEAIDDPNRGPITLLPVTVTPSPWRITMGLRRRLALAVPTRTLGGTQPLATPRTTRASAATPAPARTSARSSARRAQGEPPEGVLSLLDLLDAASVRAAEALRESKDPQVNDYARMVGYDTREMARALRREALGIDAHVTGAVVTGITILDDRPDFSEHGFLAAAASATRDLLATIDVALKDPRMSPKIASLVREMARALEAHGALAAELARTWGLSAVAAR